VDDLLGILFAFICLAVFGSVLSGSILPAMIVLAVLLVVGSLASGKH
jgi:hypothetical protein